MKLFIVGLFISFSSIWSAKATASIINTAQQENIAIAMSLLAIAIFLLWLVRGIKRALNKPRRQAVPQHWQQSSEQPAPQKQQP
jgi:cytochrome c biogenesis protein CcdA